MRKWTGNDDTREIPRYNEEGFMDDVWGKATGRVPDEPDRKKLEASEIKDRHIALMTAAVLWFTLACFAVVIGSFVLRLIGFILGG